MYSNSPNFVFLPSFRTDWAFRSQVKASDEAYLTSPFQPPKYGSMRISPLLFRHLWNMTSTPFKP